MTIARARGRHRRIGPAAVLFGLAVVAVVPAEAHACTCSGSPNPPCQAAWQADAVFAGRVAEIGHPEPSAFMPQGFRMRRIHFAVTESFLGDVASEQTVFTGLGGGDCGYQFAAGASYVVYAHRAEDGSLTTGICSRTRSTSGAGEDLAYLRSLATTPQPVAGMIRGEVLVRYRDRRPALQPAADVRVTVTGPAGRSTVVSGPDGAFAVMGPAGPYTIALEPPDGLTAFGPVDLALPTTRACIATSLVMTPRSPPKGEPRSPGADWDQSRDGYNRRHGATARELPEVASGVPGNIAEGFARRSRLDFARRDAPAFAPVRE